FRALQRWAPGAFPEVWRELEVERVGAGGLSYLIRWPASDNATRTTTTTHRQQQQRQGQQQQGQGQEQPLLPVLFISHLDVVPVAEETAEQWEQPPFSGAVAG
ncbi:hypothetical protein Agub_g4473, partial [Astrephomene gubernaculifera]